MREMDDYVIEDLGVKGAVLMQNAAEHIADAVMEHLPPGGKAAVFCGTGNNGGDGIGAAAVLLEKGVPVRVFLIGNMDKLTFDSRQMLRRFDILGGKLESFGETDGIESYLHECGVIIDAMFGIGLNSDLRGDALEAAGIINASGAFVIAADIASGVNADTGAIMGAAVKASMTVTFSMAKPGHFVEPGCTCRGKLRICDIGIPGELVEGAPSYVYAVTPEDIKLPRRRPDSHKGDYGRCLIIAGSVGYTGAPALSARSASRMGSGLVFLGVPEPIYGIMASKLDEEMPFPLPGGEHGRLSANAAGEILHRAGESDACLIGPGLGRSPEITELVQSVIQLVKTPIVLDADGLNAIAGDIGVLDEAACPLVLTPHPGEFARLAGALAPGDRLRAARAFAHTHKCVLVLKGHKTITAMPDGTTYINTTGGPAMAKGGAGDVLAGMITSLIGQRFTIKAAVLTAVYIHGLAGDMCADEYGEYSVTAGDIIKMLPVALRQI